MYKRNLFNTIKSYLSGKRFLIITGARQVGKTTLLKQIESHLKSENLPVFFINLEDPEYLDYLNQHPKNIFKIHTVPTKGKVFFLIDEIQYLDQPTNFLKYLYDEYSERLLLVVSGSSAFYIDKKFKDSLAGRKHIFNLYTLALDEFLTFNEKENLADCIRNIQIDNLSIANQPLQIQRELNEYIEKYMIYGGYPEVVLARSIEEKQEILQEIATSYMKKDILESDIKNTQQMMNLLRILSSQTGQLLNINSLANMLNISTTAINNYIYTLAKSFHVSTIMPFFTNVQKEIRKMPKIYFNDLGLRNALLRNYNSVDFRQDNGQLYENFIYRQLLDKISLDRIKFWRTQQKSEIDFIVDDKIAYEIKYNASIFSLSKYKYFRSNYPNILFKMIYHSGNPKENIKDISLLF